MNTQQAPGRGMQETDSKRKRPKKFVYRNMKVKRQVKYNSWGVAILVLISIVQAFIGLPVQVPLPEWFAVLLVASLTVLSVVAGGRAIRHINHYKQFTL